MCYGEIVMSQHCGGVQHHASHAQVAWLSIRVATLCPSALSRCKPSKWFQMPKCCFESQTVQEPKRRSRTSTQAITIVQVGSPLHSRQDCVRVRCRTSQFATNAVAYRRLNCVAIDLAIWRVSASPAALLLPAICRRENVSKAAHRRAQSTSGSHAILHRRSRTFGIDGVGPKLCCKPRNKGKQMMSRCPLL